MVCPLRRVILEGSEESHRAEIQLAVRSFGRYHSLEDDRKGDNYYSECPKRASLRPSNNTPPRLPRRLLAPRNDRKDYHS